MSKEVRRQLDCWWRLRWRREDSSGRVCSGEAGASLGFGAVALGLVSAWGGTEVSFCPDQCLLEWEAENGQLVSVRGFGGQHLGREGLDATGLDGDEGVGEEGWGTLGTWVTGLGDKGFAWAQWACRSGWRSAWLLRGSHSRQSILHLSLCLFFHSLSVRTL